MINSFPIRNSALRWLEKILSDRFGLPFILSRTNGGLLLTLPSGDGAIIFDELPHCFAEVRSDLPMTHWDAQSEGWRSVLGSPLPAPGMSRLAVPLIDARGRDCLIHYDIPGLTYWMLNRIEEVARTELDKHGRFPAIASHAYKEGYLDRPVVDEWLDVLGQVIVRQWPGAELKRQVFTVSMSHDVDQPYQYLFVSGAGILRQVMGDLIKRRAPGLAGSRFMTWMSVRDGNLHRDPFNTFDWIMDHAEKKGSQAAFYFICGHTNRGLDGNYEVEHPRIRDLLRHIHRRGHEIGLHPSYESYRRPAQIKHEFDQLRNICEQEGVQQESWGGRMHYLRWEQPETLQAWDDAGLAYDSSLGYADCPGFRCGTCHEFRAFNVKTQQALNLVERPLILMECSILDSEYMGCRDDDSAFSLMQKYRDACRSVQGNFTLLWHNNNFARLGDRLMFSRLI